MNKRTENSGAFTIVELLIVIVVIGILASIVIISFNGAQVRARNVARQLEAKQWVKLFQLYKVTKGNIPYQTSYGNHCLGRYFPNKADVNTLITQKGLGDPITAPDNPDGYCRDLLWQLTREQSDTSINDELASIGTLPAGIGHKNYISQIIIGPFVTYQSARYYVTAIYEGNSCPNDGSIKGYTYENGENAQMCEYDIDVN